LDSAVEDEANAPESSKEGATEDVVSHFFLHTIARVRLNDTMQIHIKLGNTSLIVLLDLRSTHNFIFEAAAQWSGLPIQHRSCMTATVANGERVTCLEVIRQAAFTVIGDAFFTDLFVLPLMCTMSSLAPSGS
jgi:hypothetical protein